MTSTNDGKDVKSNQSSGPKGKSYYIELYKSLDARLSGECDLSSRTSWLCEAWRRVHSLCLHALPATHPHLFNWIEKHTARTILQTEWQSLLKSKDEQGNPARLLQQAIDAYIADSNKGLGSKDGVKQQWEIHLHQRGEWYKRILGNPWGHEVFMALLGGEKPNDDKILEWLKEERGVMFVTRLKQMAASKAKCDDLATGLVGAVMDRVRATRVLVPDSEQADEPKDEPESSSEQPTFADILRTEAGFTPDVWEVLTDIELVLLLKGGRRSECIEVAKQIPLRKGYQLVERLQGRLEAAPSEKKLWKNAKDVATLVAQVVIARCMVVPSCEQASRSALYCCTRSLARLLPPEKLPAAAAALAAPAATARHLHTLAQAVDAQCSSMTNEKDRKNMKPYVCELYVRAITVGMNELERLKLKTEKEAEALRTSQTLALWFTQLGALLAASERVRCECALTAFSVHPSRHMYDSLRAAPPLPPRPRDAHETKEETTSEFGSWTTDSRTQSNLVKTSETLNMKHTQNQANVLSTAIFAEGEAIGLSPELCQDLAVLLSGPRVKTLSWDMDREVLLESCRVHMERTQGGTRALTTELKYLNLDPASYMHLPEDHDDEDDLYYGIEKGYEHLVELQDPEDVWQDPLDDPEKTESACSSSIEIDEPTRRKKKTKRVVKSHSSEEDSDPLSLIAEVKRTEKKKERPHSKERSSKEHSKERKKKTKSKERENKEGSRERRKEDPEDKGKKKEKKSRKKKEKHPELEPCDQKPGSLSSLIGLKVAKIKIPEGKYKKNTDVKTPFCVTDSDYDSQGKSSLASLNSEGNDPDVLFDGLYNMEDYASPENDPLAERTALSNSELSVINGKVAINSAARKPEADKSVHPTQVSVSPSVQNNQIRPSAVQLAANMNNTSKVDIKAEVKKSITRLIEFRRQKSLLEQSNRSSMSSPGSTASSPRVHSEANSTPTYNSPNSITRPDFTDDKFNTSPKSLPVPEIPKVYINKHQTEHLKNLKNEVDMILGAKQQNKPVLNYANKGYTQPSFTYSDPYLQSVLQYEGTSQRVQNHSVPPPPQPTPAPHPPQTNNEAVAQKTVQDFLKELQESINAGTGANKMPSTSTAKSSHKKDIRPISRVTPVIPKNMKPESGLSSQSAKSTLQTAKKVDHQLNTFSRLSYMHKTKQSDLKTNKVAVESIINYQDQMLSLKKCLEEQKAAKLKYLQSKGDIVISRVSQTPQNLTKDPAKVVVQKVEKPNVNVAKEHPMLLNMLQSNTQQSSTSHGTVPHLPVQQLSKPKDPIRNLHQAEKPRTVSPATAIKESALSEKDQNDLLLLLRQQNKLNSPTSYLNVDANKVANNQYSSNSSSINFSQNPTVSATRSVIKTAPTETKLNNTQLYQRSTNKVTPMEPTQYPKPTDSISTKVNKTTGCKKINVSLTKVSNTSSRDAEKPSGNKKVESKSNVAQDGEPKHQDWEKVMDAILKHKTPSRGPNALDMALKNESSMHSSLRNQRIIRTNVIVDAEPKPKEISKPSTPIVAKHVMPAMVHKKMTPSQSAPSDASLKKTYPPRLQTEVIQKPIQVEPPKLIQVEQPKPIKVELPKRQVEVLKRPVLSDLGKEKDLNISGIPNSDYDLLDELMDDELRKEIGELSSDEETYRAPADNTKETKVIPNKHVNVIKTSTSQQINSQVVDLRCGLKPVQDARNTIIQIPKKTNKCHNAPKTVIDSTRTHQVIVANSKQVPVESTVTKISESHTYSCPTNVIRQPTVNSMLEKNESQKQAYNICHNVNKNHINVVDSRNVIITAVQKPVVPNVVLLGSELVYDPFATVQSHLQTGLCNVNQTPYGAVNTAPNITVYQTTQFAAPVVNEVIIGNAMTVPTTPAASENMSSLSCNQSQDISYTPISCNKTPMLNSQNMGANTTDIMKMSCNSHTVITQNKSADTANIMKNSTAMSRSQMSDLETTQRTIANTTPIVKKYTMTSNQTPDMTNTQKMFNTSEITANSSTMLKNQISDIVYTQKSHSDTTHAMKTSTIMSKYQIPDMESSQKTFNTTDIRENSTTILRNQIPDTFSLHKTFANTTDIMNNSTTSCNQNSNVCPQKASVHSTEMVKNTPKNILQNENNERTSARIEIVPKIVDIPQGDIGRLGDTKTSLDINSNKNCDRKVLSEVQDKQSFNHVDKVDVKSVRNQKLPENEKDEKHQAESKIGKEPKPRPELVSEEKGVKDQERLQKKRQAILNRKVNHRSCAKPIPLGYMPLVKQKSPVVVKTQCHQELKKDLQIENETSNTPIDSCIVNEEKDTEYSKENKDKKPPFRRIVLRSSSDFQNMTASPNSREQRNPAPARKTKVRLKKSADQCTELDMKSNVKKVDEDNGSPKRVSKRILQKQSEKKDVVKVEPVEAKVTQKKTLNKNQIILPENTIDVIKSGDNENKTKEIDISANNKKIVVNKSVEIPAVLPFDTIDIEEALVGSKIPKVSPEKEEMSLPKNDEQCDDESKVVRTTKRKKSTSKIVAPTVLKDPENIVVESKPTDNESNAITLRKTTKKYKKSDQAVTHNIISNKSSTDATDVVMNKLEKSNTIVLPSEKTCSGTIVLDAKTSLKEKTCSSLDDINELPMVIIDSTQGNLVKDSKTDKKLSSPVSNRKDTENKHVDPILDRKEILQEKYELNDKTKDKLNQDAKINRTSESKCSYKKMVTDIKELKSVTGMTDNKAVSSAELEEKLSHDVKPCENDSKLIANNVHERRAVNKTNKNSKNNIKPTVPVRNKAVQNVISSKNDQTPKVNIVNNIQTDHRSKEPVSTIPNKIQNNLNVPTKNQVIDKYGRLSSEQFKSLKEKIIIEELPMLSNESDKKCVRVKIPNGKTFRATILGKMHVSFESLFADPALRAVLLNNISETKRYTVNIRQTSTVPKSNPNNIVQTRIENVNVHADGNRQVIDTVNLLSDDEDEPSHQNQKYKSLKTEFGEFRISLLNEDDFDKHVNKLQQKCIVKLTNMKASSQSINTSNDTSIIPCTEEEPDLPSFILPIKVSDYESKTEKQQNNNGVNSKTENVYIISDQKSPNENLELTSSDKPENIIEIDDSSNDSVILPSLLCDEIMLSEKLYEGLTIPRDGLTTPLEENKNPTEVIDELKNLLLKDLGVDVVSDVSKSKQDNINADKLDDGSSQKSYIKELKKCYVYLKRCDDEVKMYEQLKVTNQKCTVNLVRCDDMVNIAKCVSSDDENEQNLSDDFISLDIPSETKLSRSGSFSLLVDCSNVDDENINSFSTDDRSSPVMEVYDMISAFRKATLAVEDNLSVMEVFDLIASLRKRTHMEDIPEQNKCYCDWFTTKRELHQKEELLETQPKINDVPLFYESTFNSSVTKATNAVPTLKALTARLFQDDTILDQIASSLVLNLKPIHSPSHKLKRKICNIEDINVSCKLLKVVIDSKTCNVKENEIEQESGLTIITDLDETKQITNKFDTSTELDRSPELEQRELLAPIEPEADCANDGALRTSDFETSHSQNSINISKVEITVNDINKLDTECETISHENKFLETETAQPDKLLKQDEILNMDSNASENDDDKLNKNDIVLSETKNPTSSSVTDPQLLILGDNSDGIIEDHLENITSELKLVTKCKMGEDSVENVVASEDRISATTEETKILPEQTATAPSIGTEVINSTEEVDTTTDMTLSENSEINDCDKNEAETEVINGKENSDNSIIANEINLDQTGDSCQNETETRTSELSVTDLTQSDTTRVDHLDSDSSVATETNSVINDIPSASVNDSDKDRNKRSNSDTLDGKEESGQKDIENQVSESSPDINEAKTGDKINDFPYARDCSDTDNLSNYLEREILTVVEVASGDEGPLDFIINSSVENDPAMSNQDKSPVHTNHHGLELTTVVEVESNYDNNLDSSDIKVTSITDVPEKSESESVLEEMENQEGTENKADDLATAPESETVNQEFEIIERVIVIQEDLEETTDSAVASDNTDTLINKEIPITTKPDFELSEKNSSIQNDDEDSSDSTGSNSLLTGITPSKLNELILNGIEYEDPVAGTCYVFPIADTTSSSCENDTFDEETEEIIQVIQEIGEDGTIGNVTLETKEVYIDDYDFKLNKPKLTYSRLNKTNWYGKSSKRPLKRKIDMSDIRVSEKKYRKGKNIDYPKITAAAMIDSAYGKEFKRVIDYCSSLKFSYTQPYHKDFIDVDEIIRHWPLGESYCDILQEEYDDAVLFSDFDNIEQRKVFDPVDLTLAEEISAEYSESDLPSNVAEINFNMGFGEGSDRVIQNLEDVGDDSKFSAATLSDVKQPQPFLPSEDNKNSKTDRDEISDKTREDQIKQLKRCLTYIQMRDRVRSFFRKTSMELTYDWLKQEKKDTNKSGLLSNFPFELYNTTDFLEPSPADICVQVVQVGQLPVSAAAQNPVTCDPRVTQVSDASPSQCSVDNSPQDDSQPTIKTEYTELTTADLSVPLMQEYAQHNQTLPDSQEPTNMSMSGENIPIETEMKSVVKIELMEEPEEKEEHREPYETNCEPQDTVNKHENNAEYSFDTNSAHDAPAPETESDFHAMYNSTEKQTITETFPAQQEQKQQNGAPEKTDQIAHAMNAAGITTSSETMTNTTRAHALVNILSQKLRQGSVGTTQATNSYSKTTSINAMALQQALAQILPPPLNQTNSTENNQQGQNTPQVLHIVQGKNATGSQITLVDNTQQSVINAPNATPVLHIVQNKSGTPNATSNGAPTQQTNSFGGLSLVDAGLQQGGNQLLHIVNAGSQKNSNAAGQLLKRVNLLTNLTNVQGSNEQKMVQFVCKSADGKAIQLNAPHQRSMVLRLQPIETPNVQATPPKPAEGQDLSPTSNASNSLQGKDNASQQEIKSRSVYEENYAKFIQNSSSKSGTEKSTSLPKFNQAFGKPVFQEGGQNQNDMNTNNSHLTVNTKSEPGDCQATDNAMNLDHIGQISSPPLLLRKSPAQTSQSQGNLVQQLKQTITPMNIQTMHGGVIYTRQIPVNIGGGQTINLITVPSTELVDDSAQKPQPVAGQSDIEPSIIKIVPQNQTAPNAEISSEDGGAPMNVSNEGNQNPQPQPVLTQMRIKLPMLSKTPQMVSGARVVRPSFFQIQRNVIGGTNQPVYQQLVLTAAPPLGQQTIRLPQTQTSRQIKVPTDGQSSAESQMSSSTLEQLREFDMVLEQVKERSSVPPNSSSNSSFSKLNTPSTDTTDGSSASSTSTETTQQVLYSIGNNHQPLNVAYVNRKATVTTPTTSTFVRSPDSSGIVDSPTSSTHVQIPHTVTTDSSQNDPPTQPKPKVSSKSKSRPKASSNPPNNLKLNTVPPKTSAQKPLEDEQTTQRILYILAEYKEQVENSPDKDKPAPRRRSNPPSNPSGSSKRKKSSSGSRRHGARDLSPIHGEDTCRTMGSEDSSCGTSQGDCNESCLESHSPQDSPRKVVRKLTFDNETPASTPRPQPQRNVIVADGQTITVARGTAGKPATAVLMPANYILPVSMVKGGQQIAIVTNRGPKLLTVGGGEGGATNALLLQRLIGPAGLKPVLARPGVRHVRLPTAALHNLQAFNLAAATAVQPPDSTASPAPAPTPPELVDTRANSSPWTDRDCQDVKPERGSSPEGSEPWNLPSSGDPHDYSYEETVRADHLDRTVLDPIPDRYSPDMEAQRIFDKMFDVESRKSYMGDSPRCAYDIDASDCDDKPYHQVVQKKDGPSHRQHRLTHVSAAALRHKYAILEHELRLQKSLSEECEDLGVDSPSASELFPEAELLFAASPAHDHTQDHAHHSHTPQPPLLTQSSIPQPDMDDQIATDQLLSRVHDQDLNLGLEDVGIVTVSEDGMQATIALDQEEFARAHPNTTFHSEPEEGEVQPFTISGLKGRHITSTIFHSNRAPATVLMTAPQTTVISQATADHHQPSTVKYSDIDNMINSLPSANGNSINLSSVLVKDEGLTRFDSILSDSRELHLSNTASAIVHSAGNATQVIRRVCYDDDKRDRFLMDEPDALIAGDDAKMIAEDSSRDATLESMAGDVDDDRSSPERHTELFWESNSASERSESRRPLDFSSDSEKCCKSPSYDETNSTDSSGVGTHMRLDSVIKDARGMERSGSADGSSADDTHPPLRTYPPKRMYGLDGAVERSLSGKTRAGERSPEARGRRASGRGVVKRGCHCCNGSPAPPRPKKSRQRKPTMDFNTN